MSAVLGLGVTHYPGLYAQDEDMADLLRRTQQYEAAADAYERALVLCGNSTERAYLQRRLGEMNQLVD